MFGDGFNVGLEGKTTVMKLVAGKEDMLRRMLGF